MIKFSLKNKAFYNMDLDYSDLPNDLIEVSNEQHLKLLNAINSGCIIFDDLTFSAPKPSRFHTWNGSEWIDQRTPEQIAEYERSLLKSLTKRQFSLYLYDIGKYDDVMNALNANQRFKIEFETVATIERNSPTVQAMAQVLEWDAETVDNHWKEALKL